jgi:hypothetical protein
MALIVKKKNAAAVALGRKGGKKGGPARAAKLTPEERSESARIAVQARWSKAKKEENGEAAPATSMVRTDRKALHHCLKRIKDAKDETELRRLTEELQRIVFHRQFQSAKN